MDIGLIGFWGASGTRNASVSILRDVINISKGICI